MRTRTRTREQAPEQQQEEKGQGQASEQQDEVTELILPSEAPPNRRASAISRVPSMSVKNLLNSSMGKSPVPRYELLRDMYEKIKFAASTRSRRVVPCCIRSIYVLLLW